jgi:hypothetical protein
MSKAKNSTAAQPEFIPPSAASQDPVAQPATSQQTATLEPPAGDREPDPLYLRMEAVIFGLCDFLGWPRDFEAFAEKIKEHSAVRDFIPHKDDPILNLQAAGDLIGRSGQTIRNWIAEGYIESEIDPSGLRRVRRSKLLRFFQGTALASPFTVEGMTESQQAQYDVEVQGRYATIYCKLCNHKVIENTDRPALWLATHAATCSAESFADANRPH